MDWPEIGVVLDALGISTEGIRPNNKNWVLVPCPLAPWLHSKGTDENPSLGIKVNCYPSVYRCFSCGERGKLWDLVDSCASFREDNSLYELSRKLLESDRASLDSLLTKASTGLDSFIYEFPEKRGRVFSEELLDVSRFPFALGNRKALAYLASRKILSGTIEYYDIRYDPRMHRIVFPVRDQKGGLVGAVGRIIDGPDPRRYYNYFGFEAGLYLGGLHRVSRERLGLIIVEGFFDILNAALWAHESDYDIVCTFHADVSKEQAGIISALNKNIVIAYDHDEAGERGFERAYDRLSSYSYGLRRLLPDLLEDVGSMSKETFMDKLEEVRCWKYV